MSKLEDLVPPIELCKLIPEGEFGDSCFVRIGKDTIIQRSNVRVVSGRQDDIYPAPTLQEILRELNEADVWHINASLHFCKSCRKHKSPSGDALKMWLVWKGILKNADLR